MPGARPGMTSESFNAWVGRVASSPPAVRPALLIVGVLLPRIGGLGAPVTPTEEAALVPRVTARDAGIGRGLARDEAALRLVVQRNDELRAIVGLLVQGLVRNDDRGPWQRGRRDAVEHLLRDGDAVECGLGVVL